jgi:DNA-binding Xre family transcriptional regulator
MTLRMTYTWNLRALMSAAGMYQTTDLHSKLQERGITLSREQVYRLVTTEPQRLNMDVLAALCDIFDVGPGELITVERRVEPVTRRKANARHSTEATPAPVRATIRRPKD